MKASTGPAGMTDDELATAERHHQTLGDTYQRMAAKAESELTQWAHAKLAATHQSTADGCRKEQKRRKRESR
ncbi:MAG: hypothetical protein ACRCTO_23100 [Pseudomonas paracarnis]